MKEIRETKDAGDRALISLENAQGMPNSAGNWDLLDMVGGDLISGLMKYSKISSAN